MRQPALVVHCDWSLDERKRWMAAATYRGGRWTVTAPEPVGDLGGFFERLRRRVPVGPILCGLDMAVGVPRAYARAAGIERFAPMLECFGAGKWSGFYDVAERADQISPQRPFYPRAPGGKRIQHLVDALGLASSDDLLRRCDHATATRGRA